MSDFDLHINGEGLAKRVRTLERQVADLEQRNTNLLNGLVIVSMGMSFGSVLTDDHWKDAMVDAGFQLMKSLPEQHQAEILRAVRGGEVEP